MYDALFAPPSRVIRTGPLALFFANFETRALRASRTVLLRYSMTFRSASMNLNGTKVLRRRALQIKQNDSCPLYLFSLTGEDLLAIAEISRISRNDAGTLIG